MTYPLHVTSEIGKLKTVLLHRPGREVENLTPDTLEELLFDDIPYLPLAQQEHDAFAKAMQERGVETIYLEKLAAEALSTPELRKEFLNKMLTESGIKSPKAFDALTEYLLAMDNQSMIDSIMSGIRKSEVEVGTTGLKLSEMVRDNSLFYLNPMPNLYFTRDPAATIGEGISINRMYAAARRRESLFMEYIMKHHPRFAPHNVPIWFDRYSPFHMEGGDQLVLSEEVVAVGVSLRTEAAAIEEMALNIFKNSKHVRKVLAIEIPVKRAFMHLDTVFTMVDYDKFTIHPEILNDNGDINIYTVEPGKEEGYVHITHSTDLFETLKQTLGLKDVALIQCGNGDPIVAPREQWSDGSNTLAIAPGVVVTYDRNYVSNEALRQHGIEVIEIISGELSRGRGGPRCMSMPIYRENI